MQRLLQVLERSGGGKSEAAEPDSTCAKSALSPIDTPNTSPDTSAVALNDR